jgi:hypothetical protein
MKTPDVASTIAAPLRELLTLDRSLSPSERKLLESLLLEPGGATARELARRTGTNAQGLYVAIDRLIGRGLVVREPRGGVASFRSTHPSAVLRALLEPGRRAFVLADALEGPLSELHRARAPEPSGPPTGGVAATTSSTTAASGWLVELLGSAAGEVWFLGDESPWFPADRRIEKALTLRRDASPGLQVRMLVPPASANDERADRHQGLVAEGVALRYSARFTAPTVIVDRRWLVIGSSSTADARSGGRTFVKIDSPDLCRDLLRAGQDAWARANSPPIDRPIASARGSRHPSAL